MANILEYSDYLALSVKSIPQCSCQSKNEWIYKTRSFQEQNTSIPSFLSSEHEDVEPCAALLWCWH